jgi:hypothetical protein
MSLRGHRSVFGSTLAGVAFLSLALAGCNKAADDTGNASAALPALPATLPMTNAPAAPAALAPPPSAIPARSIRTARVANPRAAYAYADQADYFSRSLGDGPPDYGFDYDGVRPWAWQGYDGSRVFLEPVDGGYRYYYYRAGADEPYFIRDPEFAYGYDGDQLAVVYDSDGAIVPYGDYGPRTGYAAAYLWRAERLFEASSDREAISAAAWAARQNAIAGYQERWAANRDRQADWAAYHAQESAQESRYWAEEAARRDADQQRFAAWQQQDFRTPPPPRAIPPRWQQASWAQDNMRYAPVVAGAAGIAAIGMLAHHRQAAADRDVPQQPRPAFGAPPPQPMAARAAPTGDRGVEEARRGPAARPPEPSLRAAVASSSPAQRAGFAQYERTAPHRPEMRQAVSVAPQVRYHAAPAMPAEELRRPVARPVEPAAIVHGGSGAPFRAAPREMERHAEPPHVAMMNASPPRRAPEAPRAPVAAPRMAEHAPPHGGGEHPGGGHPGGGDHRR